MTNQDPSMTLDPKAVWPGWETVGVLGRGSFGAVYEIHRDVLGDTEKAALKLITIPQSSSDIDELYGEGYDSESITSTFKAYLKSIVAEYSMMRRLNDCANVVNCDDIRYIQHTDGFGWDIYIKMELLTPLTRALPKEIPEEMVRRIGADLCKALVQCKKHNIVHRDIKPANIFVSDNGVYKLGDFGIARTMERTTGGTKTGTYDYMAPEVYHDEPYGSTVDIYSLGMVLYWLLNERRTAFLALPPTLPSSLDKEQARKRRFGGEEIPAPAHGSPELQRIVLKAIAYDPKARYQSAEELLRDLENPERKESAAVSDAGQGAGGAKSESASSETEHQQTISGAGQSAGFEQQNTRRDDSQTVSAQGPGGGAGFGGQNGQWDGQQTVSAHGPVGGAGFGGQSSQWDGQQTVSAHGPVGGAGFGGQSSQWDGQQTVSAHGPVGNTGFGGQNGQWIGQQIGPVSGPGGGVGFGGQNSQWIGQQTGPVTGPGGNTGFSGKNSQWIGQQTGPVSGSGSGSVSSQTGGKPGSETEKPPKKKWLPILIGAAALILVLVVVLVLVPKGQKAEQAEPTEAPGSTVVEQAAPATVEEPAPQPARTAVVDIRVAMITDFGDITDQSFNQTTYEACREYCEDNGLPFQYYKPAFDSDDERIAMIERAIDDGYNVIVMSGYMFAPAIADTAPRYPDVYFIALDVSEYDLLSAGLDALPANLYSAVYQEELGGYMAGYAAVMLGYRNLGFLGGMAVPAVIRYGYGFVQGVDDAAAELGLTDVTINYAYGNQFYGDADITAAMDTWYANGTEVVFACGGGIFTSAAEAAAKVGGKVIGIDVDQAPLIDGLYGSRITLTSAMKGLAPTVKTMLAAIEAGKFEGGKVENLGLVSENPEENYMQLPMGSTQFSDSFTVEDYRALVARMLRGELTVDNDITKSAADFASVITVKDLGNLK